MTDSKILEKFFAAQHQKLAQKTDTVMQCICGSHPFHSEYAEWLRRKNGQAPEGSASSSCPFHEIKKHLDE